MTMKRVIMNMLFMAITQYKIYINKIINMNILSSDLSILSDLFIM